MEKQAVIKRQLVWTAILWWVIISVIYSLLLNETLKGFHLTVPEIVADNLVSNLLLAGCCILIVHNMRFYLPRQEKYVYVLFISLGLAAVSVFTGRLVLWLLFRTDVHYTGSLSQTMGIRFAISCLLIACMSILSLLWYTQQEQKSAADRRKDAEQLTREAELFKLRQQLQPHFLFNSLNSISALIGSKPEEARKMIHQLSDFLRGTLKKEDQQWVHLCDELDYLSLYLDIEKVRFGHRLQTSITSPETAGQMKLPAMLLQPIVENAIKFGLYDTVEDITIAIGAAIEENFLIITVSNPFDPQTASPQTGTGFGLSSVRRRLYLLFSRNDLLQTSTDGHIFITTVKIPQT